MSNTIADQHIKLVLLVLDTQHHGHGLTDLHDAAHLAGPGAFANLKIKKWVISLVCLMSLIILKKMEIGEGVDFFLSIAFAEGALTLQALF